jgi:nucleoside-diphosphate-sugar epimerase
LRQGKISLIDGGRGFCNTTYVDNLADAIFLALQNPQAVGEAFFITDGESLTWGDFVRTHAALMNPAPRLADISSEEVLNYYQSLPNRWTASVAAVARLLVGSEGRNTLKQVPVIADLYQWLWYRFQSLNGRTQDRIRARLGGDPLPSRGSASGPPIPDLETLAVQTCETRFSIEKARRILGYNPRIDFAEGMRLTAEWLRFANYL